MSIRHNTHIARNDIEQLGQFINGSLADKVTELKDTRVVRQLENGAVHLVAVLGFDFIEPLVCIGVHGAEFPHAEGLAVQARALLTVENLTLRITDFDADCCNQPQR